MEKDFTDLVLKHAAERLSEGAEFFKELKESDFALKGDDADIDAIDRATKSIENGAISGEYSRALIEAVTDAKMELDPALKFIGRESGRAR